MTTPSHQSTAELVLADMATMNEAAPADAADQEEQTDQAEADVEVEEQGAEEEAPSRRGLSWEDAMRKVPPDIARLMRNMQADYTKKTQALASQRKEFLREREALLKGKQAIQDREEIPKYDPFDEDSVKARIEVEVNRRLREVLEPMQAEYETMQAEDDYQRFIADHPDFESDTGLRSEVQHLLESNESLDLETAYWAARGKKSRIEEKKSREDAAARRRASKEAALRGTAAPRRGAVASKPSTKDLRKMSTADILKLAQSMHRD